MSSMSLAVQAATISGRSAIGTSLKYMCGRTSTASRNVTVSVTPV